MTDFAQEMLREEEPEPPVAVRAQDEAAEERAKAAGNAALAALELKASLPPAPASPLPVAPLPVAPEPAAAEPIAPVRAQTPPGPGRQAIPQQAPAEERRVTATVETASQPAASAIPHPEAERTAILIETLALFAVRPEAASLAPLFEAYTHAPMPEVGSAAGAIAAVFLRAPAKARRPMLDVLAPVLRDWHAAALARLLAAKLGGAAIMRGVPPPPPPEDG
jgi:hypothetical protein